MGFILGYLSGLIPILLIGVGSIAPGLIGDALNRFKHLTDATAKDKYILQNVAKFIVGYTTGLPINRFYSDGITNIPEFFQIRPSPNKAPKGGNNKAMFDNKRFDEVDVARFASVCICKLTYF